MHDSKRGIFLTILAGIAALVTAWGNGYYAAALNYPKELLHQSYLNVADKATQIDPVLNAPFDTKPLEHRFPCDNPIGHDESALCAQWRAATAAEHSALWAKWGFWIGLGGMVGLFWTLYYTRRAVKATSEATDAMREQNGLARETMERQLRAYIVSPSLNYEIRTNLPEQGFNMLLWSEWRNMGQTPTRGLRIYFVSKILDASAGCLGIAIESDGEDGERHQLGPGQQVRSPNICVSDEDVSAIYSGAKELFVAGLAMYRDSVTDIRRETRFCYKVRIFRDRALPLEGMNIHSIAWEVIGHHNCSDDECEDC